MGIFGDDLGQDERLDELERQVRRLVEEVQQLTVDLGVTRTELLRARLDLKQSVRTADIDPAISALNDLAARSRAALRGARDAGDDQWRSIQADLEAVLDELRREVDAAWVQESQPS
ncbi:MAG: hypothetical protein KF906_08860 [Actinobacteria bacterium]|nr:hypothetical protein [Actinomycetota bacterium]